MAGHSLNSAIRPLRRDDIGSVGSIFAWYVANSVATFEEIPRSDRDWTRLWDELRDLGLPFLVAEADGAVAGYAYAGPWRSKPAYRRTVEDSIFIAPGQTGRGIGSQLLTELVAACGLGGARQMIAVIADTGSNASVALHESSGFAHVGRLTAVGYKHGRYVDTLLMQRELTP
jgi:L-amino acid N-acyltransferase YncA